jgi:serine/threonine-protein kinase
MFDTAAQREIGPYAVHELIGWGGMSRVYRATDTSHGDAEVAIKVLSDSMLSDVEYEQYFMREIEMAGMLYHPHILAVLGFGRDQGMLFMVMPLVKGGTLANVLQLRGPLSPRQTLVIVEQIGAALDYVHSSQMVHCDIKPANILLCDGGSYVLADFGLVKRVDELPEAASNDVMGSPPYMSPEQGRGDVLDHRSDLYSLGLVLYECLTGRLPYSPPLLVESMGYQVTARPITPRQIAAASRSAWKAPRCAASRKTAPCASSPAQMAEALSAAIDKLGYEDAHRPLVLQGEIERAKHLNQQGTIGVAVHAIGGTVIRCLLYLADILTILTCGERLFQVFDGSSLTF